MAAPIKSRDTSFREAIDTETSFVLLHNENFLADMQSLREREGIPELKPTSDRWRHDTMVYDKIIEMIDSRWLDGKVSREKQERIDGEIGKLVIKYFLPFHFDEWVRHILLYRSPPRERPTFMDNDLISSIARGRTLHFPLSTKEKKFWLLYFRSRLGFENGRVPKKYARAYRQLNDILNSQKNTRRRSRTYRNTIKAEILLKEPVISANILTGKNELKRRTLTDVAGALNPIRGDHVPSAKEDRKIAATLRQRISRQKRHKLSQKIMSHT